MMFMKSLEELKNNIYLKIAEIRNFDIDDSKIFNDDDSYNREELSVFLAMHKKKRYMKSSCMRMIRNYLNRKYAGWQFSTERQFSEDSFLSYVNDFKRFG